MTKAKPIVHVKEGEENPEGYLTLRLWQWLLLILVMLFVVGGAGFFILLLFWCRCGTI